jgi:ABC-type transport system substrate-binding protein
LAANEVQVGLQLQPTDVDPLKSNSSLKIEVHPSLFLDHCYFNFSKPPFNNKDVRLAVNYAIDRKAINDALTFGLGTPASQAYPPGYWAYQKDLDSTFTLNVAKAKELLAKAGMANGLTIKGVTTTASNFARLNELIQAQLANVGIKMTFEQMQPAAATTAFFTKLDPDIYCSAWSGRPDASQTARSLFGVPSFFNAGAYDAPGMADALNASGSGQDIGTRAKAFHDVVKISQDEALHVPIVFVPNVDAYSTKVKGFVPTLGKPDVSFLWLEK